MPFELEKNMETDEIHSTIGDKRVFAEFINWYIRRYFPDEVDRLRDGADHIYFESVTVDGDYSITVRYSTRNEVDRNT